MIAPAQPLVRAEELARSGDVARAVVAAHEALAAGDTGPRTHALLAEIFLAGDFFEPAIESATRAIELDPDCVPAYLSLGLAYDRRGGMWDQSVLVWHELAEVDPGLVVAHVQLGEAFFASGFETEAIEAWRQALTIDPHNARAMYNLAIAALRREGMATALPGFRKAGELDPSQDGFFFRLAGVYDHGVPAPDPDTVEADRVGRLEAAFALALEDDLFSAMDLVRLVLAEESDEADALALAGHLYLKQGAVLEAMAVALRALSVAPKTPIAVYVLGTAFARHSTLNRNAARVFGALASAVPDHPMSHVLNAESLLGLQRYGDARAAYERAVALDPTLVRARFGLAAALTIAGEHALARHEIRRAAYHDTRRAGEFWRLYDAYTAGEGGRNDS